LEYQRQQQINNTLEIPKSVPSGIPVIHTLESDADELIKSHTEEGDHLGVYKRLSQDVGTQSEIQQQLQSQDRKSSLLMWLLMFSVLFAIAGGLAYYYFTYITKKPSTTTNNVTSIPTNNSSVVNSNNSPKDVIPNLNTNPTNTLTSVWPAAAEVIGRYTGDVSKTDKHILIEVKSFDYVYANLIQNESLLAEAGKSLGYDMVGEFRDTSINNIDLRVADANTGALIYGYINQNKLLISNSLQDWMDTYNNIVMNTN
jgi:flagellar basal body-associated protein FliL